MLDRLAEPGGARATSGRGGDQETLSVLVTGFGPFPGAPFNPTRELVARLVRLPRPGWTNVRVAIHIFRTSYAAVDAELPKLIRELRPQVVLMFGLAARTKFVRIETGARNACTVLLADASGRSPAGGCIVAGGPARLRGRAPFVPLAVAACAAGIPARLSRDAGRYLCNYGYWRALEAAPAGCQVLFVHVPKVPWAARPIARIRRKPVTMAALVSGGDAILRALVRVARRV